MSDAAKSPKAANRMRGVDLYAQQLGLQGRPPLAYGLPQAQVDAQQMHAAMMNNNIAMQQMAQMRNLQRAAAAADWPRHGVPHAPALHMNQYIQLHQPDPFAVGGLFPQAQHGPFDPAARRPQLNFPAPLAMGAVPFPAFGDQQQPNRGNERGRFGGEPRRRDRDHAN